MQSLGPQGQPLGPGGRPLAPAPVSESPVARAREQAAAYDSVFVPAPLQLSNGDVLEIPPHPNLRMLDDDCQAAYEALLFEVETECDRSPDIVIPEQRLESGAVIPGETRKGYLLEPYRKTVDGKTTLLDPPYTVQVVRAALGEQKWNRLKAGGGQAADVQMIWADQAERIAERERVDPKSNGRGSGLAALARANRQ